MRLLAAAVLMVVGGVVACSGAAPDAPVSGEGAAPAQVASAPDATSQVDAADTPPMVGGDRDEHGCIPSAGYRWCAKTNQCERPWELAKAKGFELSQEGFDQYCGETP